MKRVVLFMIVVIMAASSTGFAQMTFQVYTRITAQPEGKYLVEPDINIYGQKLLTKKFGVWGFALVEKNWAEAYGGVLYSPAEWVEITLGAGIEQCSSLYRLSANVWMGGQGFSFSLLTEKGDGPDNWWYKSVLKYKVGNFNLGIMAWRFHGIGPLVEYTPLKRATIWLNPVYDPEFKEQRVVIGVDIKI